MVLLVTVAAALWAGTAVAQYFPPTPEGLTVIDSKHEEGVKISYKEVRMRGARWQGIPYLKD